MCTVFPINKHPPTRNPPNDINRPTRNPPKRHQLPTRNLSKRNCRGDAYVPARTFAQRRFHTKNTRIVRGELNDGCALVGRRGRAHRHRPYLSPPNHAVCPYPIGVILSIAQGWQVQRSLPWVTMQARRLPPWGLYFFHHIAF